MSIDEQAGIVPAMESIEHAAESMMLEEETQAAASGGGGGFGFSLPDWVWIEASSEELSPKYTEHPLNVKHSEGMAQVIRGFSALFGSVLNYWWVDVVMGFMKMRTGGKGQV